MKRNMKRFLLAIGVVTLGMGFTACEDEPDKFELTDGNPTKKQRTPHWNRIRL